MRVSLLDGAQARMIDNLSLALSHGLMILAAWLLLRRSDLDREDGGTPSRFGRKPGKDQPRA